MLDAHGSASGDGKKKLTKLDATLERLEATPSALPAQELRWHYERTLTLRDQTLAHLDQLDQYGVAHLHPQEPEARVMRCDPRPLFAYNAQAVVDHEHDMIVAIGLTTEENDLAQLVPMLQQEERVLGHVAARTVVDTGYASGAQLHEAERKRLPVLTPVQAESDKGLLPKSSFTYDEQRDEYVCPRGERLPLEDCRKMSKDASCETAIYRCHDDDCPERAACTRDRKGRTVKRTPFDEAVEHQRTLLAQPAMRNLYDLRKEIVEHIFGCLKGNDGLRRFLVRGFAKALAQWALACIAFNLRKFQRLWADGLVA